MEEELRTCGSTHGYQMNKGLAVSDVSLHGAKVREGTWVGSGNE